MDRSIRDTRDTPPGRTLSQPMDIEKVTIESCTAQCAAQGFNITGLEYGQECCESLFPRPIPRWSLTGFLSKGCGPHFLVDNSAAPPAIALWRAKLTTVSCVAHLIDSVFTPKTPRYRLRIERETYVCLVYIHTIYIFPFPLLPLHHVLSVACNLILSLNLGPAGKFRIIELNQIFLQRFVYDETERGALNMEPEGEG